MLTPNPPSYYLRVGEKLRILSREELTMKKVITILAILALVAGMAFADPEPNASTPVQETHTIRIKSVVTNIRPVFQLVLSSATSNVAAVNTSGYDSITNNGETPNRFTGTNEYDPYDGTAAVNVGFSISEGGSVTFKAQLNNATNTCESYKLKFSGGEFTGIKRYNENSDNVGPSSIAVTAGTKPQAEGQDVGISSITAGNEDDVTITFRGQLGNSVDLPFTVATAVYTYNEDKTIDADTYYADVTLTVTSV